MYDIIKYPLLTAKAESGVSFLGRLSLVSCSHRDDCLKPNWIRTVHLLKWQACRLLEEYNIYTFMVDRKANKLLGVHRALIKPDSLVPLLGLSFHERKLLSARSEPCFCSAMLGR